MVKGFGLWHRADAQLAGEGFDAAAVLARGRHAVTLVEVKAHQLAVNFFAERIVRQDAMRAGDGQGNGARALVAIQQTLQRSQVVVAQAFLLLQNPIVVEAAEKIALIIFDCSRQ